MKDSFIENKSVIKTLPAYLAQQEELFSIYGFSITRKSIKITISL